ncbi:hypothetical protein SKAU_G00174740 [Synaphobranchus kaupii]|uniref:Uncharacterized protein n=1 Tax=Synaphobranchus kaupii TaxID=118154 RepID=A0A9Q1FL33_SYNKA|nr:hypothetical protein SKAU_G00174740 [Synaphobranchus kaupii]
MEAFETPRSEWWMETNSATGCGPSRGGGSCLPMSSGSLPTGLRKRTIFIQIKKYLANITALGSQLVDLGLSDVGTLLRFLHLMLHLPVPGQVSVGLFLL